MGYDRKNKRIYIESANVLGLKTIPVEKRHPMYLSSKGMGVLLKCIIADIDAGNITVDDVIIGVGGTGTNDMGIGLLTELGLILCNVKGKELLPLPVNFRFVKHVLWRKKEVPFNIELIADVNNTILGLKGASFVFGKQKGLTDREIQEADDGFANLIKIIKNSEVTIPGFLSGAGGGLAAGFQIFLKAGLTFADKFITGSLKLNSKAKYDAVIIGEGAFDEQSLMNKGTGAIIKMFTGTDIPVILCCGRIDRNVVEKLPANVHLISLSAFFKSELESIEHFEEGIKMACDHILKII